VVNSGLVCNRIEVVHEGVSGRLRLSVRKLYRERQLAEWVETTLATRPGIRFAKANTLTASLLVLHEPEMTRGEVLERVAEIIGGQVSACKTGPSPGAAHAERQWKPEAAANRRDRRMTGLSLRRPKHDRTASVESVPGFEPRGWHGLSPSDVCSILDVDADRGLESEDALRRLARFGLNRLDLNPGRSELAILIGQFISVPVGMLAVSAAVSVLTGGLLDALVILAVVAINGVIGYATERQAEQTIRGLADLRPHHCRVLRGGEHLEIQVEALVPGDQVLLAPGSAVAADLRLLESRQLSIDESALTGESLPVEKDAGCLLEPDIPLAERINMAYMGTAVTGGAGRGLVVATAHATELGRIHSLLGEVRPPDTPLQIQLDRLGSRLALLSSLVCLGVFGVGLARGLGWITMLKSSVSLAVAAVPEGLPTVATSTLALGIAEMRRRQVAIRQLDAVETLGSVQVLCLDKTGTLTRNHMAVACIEIGIESGPGAESRETRRRLLEMTCLCSEAVISQDSHPLGSATETALIERAMAEGVELEPLRRGHPLIEVHQRAEGRPVMSSFHRTEDNRILIAAKGSPRDLLERCDYLVDEQTPLDESAREAIQRANDRMASDALRVLGVAYRVLKPDPEAAPRLDTRGLIWLGLVGLSDALRPGMAELMRDFHDAGIKTVMITGDQCATASAVGRTLDLSGHGDVRVLDSSDLDRIDPAMLRGLVPDVDVFARVSPAHKLRIVQAFQHAGRVVAMTGDGINDGPALKAADNGVAMGQAGTDLARSVADVVLEDDNLHTMLVAVGQGRTIYANIRKTLHFLLATNFSEIEMMLVAIALGLGSPLNPMQLLWINLMSDIFPGLALSMEPAEPGVIRRPPRDQTEPIVSGPGLARMAAESGVITAGSMAAYGYGLARYGPGAVAGTIAFNALTLGQLLHALSCRSEQPILWGDTRLPRNPKLELALGLSIGVQVLANLVPGLRRLLGLTPITLPDLAVVTAGAALPLLVNEALKAHARTPG
jgi:P-type Ca2+ transporter type 2C